MRLDRTLIALAACIVILELGACSSNQSNRGQIPIQKTHPLPEIPPGDPNFSNYKPTRPYQELGPNAMARTIFEAAGLGGYRIEVKDLRVDVQKKAENISFPGAAFLQVLDGAGAMISGGKRHELSSGAMVSMSQGQTAILEGTSKEPLILRVRLIRAE